LQNNSIAVIHWARGYIFFVVELITNSGVLAVQGVRGIEGGREGQEFRWGVMSRG
jgi:hypothetical protein